MPQKDLHITSKISWFSFTYVIIKTTMLLEWYLTECFIKNENWLKFQGLQSVGPRTLFYPIGIMRQILTEDSGNLKHLENVKSINNTTVSLLVSCGVIPRPATMKGWEKEVFWKMLLEAWNVLNVIPSNLSEIYEKIPEK